MINNTNSTITAINLSSAVFDIFGFDGDGICGTSSGSLASGSILPGYNFVGGTDPCVNSILSPASNSGANYGGPYVTFTNINAGDTSGTVNFGNGGIAPGGSSYFSLEDPVDLNLVVTQGTPEPGTLALFGIGICGVIFRRSRKTREP